MDRTASQGSGPGGCHGAQGIGELRCAKPPAHGQAPASVQRAPIVIEIVDARDRIESFLPTIDAAIEEGLATLEKVEVRFYRSRGEDQTR